MITTKSDLRFYLQEDAKRNGIANKFKYFIGLLYGKENSIVVKYLRLLRKTEYFTNTSKTIIGKCFAMYFKIRLRKYGLKHNILIVLNSTGYGLRIPHIVGGGV